MELQKVEVRSLEFNPFVKIQEQWALLGAGTMDSFNMMTVNWGGLGVIWFKDVCTVYVRESRYTKEFMDKNELFTLTFLKAGHEDALKLCGAKSGRDIDKMKASGLTPLPLDGTVGFAEAELTLVCRKLYCGELYRENFLYEETLQKAYPDGDYHTMYIGEIVAAYTAKA